MTRERALEDAIVTAIRDGLREALENSEGRKKSKKVDLKFATLVVSVITAMIAFLGGIYQVNKTNSAKWEELLKENQFQVERDTRAQADLLELERHKLMKTIFLDILQKADAADKHQDVIRANIGALRVFERPGLPYLIMVRDFWIKKGRGQFVDYADIAIREILLGRMKIDRIEFSLLNEQKELVGRSNLRRVDLRGIDFSKADFRSCDLDGASFQNTVLSDADFKEASLMGADFQDADLSGANFNSAILTEANFTGADLSGTDFRGADLEGVALSKARHVVAARFSAVDLLNYHLQAKAGKGPLAHSTDSVLVDLVKAHKDAMQAEAKRNTAFKEKLQNSLIWQVLGIDSSSW
jgi:uncharacterized protein YjbI with pentapeptide repeats